MSEKLEIETCYFDPGYVLPTEFPDIICARALNEVIHYIRTDKAKEREAKLIRAAYYYPTSLADAETIEDASTLLLKKARLEELK